MEHFIVNIDGYDNIKKQVTVTGARVQSWERRRLVDAGRRVIHEGDDTAFAEDIGLDEKNPFNLPSSGALGTHDASLTVIDNGLVD